MNWFVLVLVVLLVLENVQTGWVVEDEDENEDEDEDEWLGSWRADLVRAPSEESKAAWRFVSRRSPRRWRVFTCAGAGEVFGLFARQGTSQTAVLFYQSSAA